ncbi:NADH-cytochrome b5 reductase-like [Nymphalis io]|uniref:NADH-cytochrome b5 reductase-like n=1 Tax=Inachis io TaxID=171585 RepID=UPI002168350B|nr:NADH-cytochrome b5 reductase-like [Nymphalis io]
MKPPIEPRKEDCCNSGCNPCIFDVFQRQLEKFKRSKETGENINKDNGISELEYTNFIVTDIIKLSETQKCLKFKLFNNTCKNKVRWNPGEHFLIKYISNVNSCSCTRAYTPIKLKEHENEDFDFLIIIKKYNNGLVSNHLYNLELGAVTMWRGPYGHYKVEPNKYNRIIMIAQGTGIAPFISIIDNILNNEDDMTKIVLCFCCRNIDEVLFRNELYQYKAYWNFSYKIYLGCSLEKITSNLKYKEPIYVTKFDIKELTDLKPFVNIQFLVCGSDQFMQEYKNILKNENYTDNIILF